MAELTFPEEYKDGFVAIRGLEEDQVRELVAAFKDEPATLNRAEVQKRLQAKTSIPPGDLASILEALISLYALRDSVDEELPVFVEVISGMINQSSIEELAFASEKEREHFEAKLFQLLSIGSLDIAARATDVLYERERTIHGKPRIFTDLRPIFEPGPEPSPRGAAIVHTLKISYHEDRQVRELFVALDTENVNELIGVLERANSKAEALKEFLSDTDLQYIDVE